MIAVIIYIITIYVSIRRISALNDRFLPVYILGLVVRLIFVLLNVAFSFTIVDGDNDAVGFLEEATYLFDAYSFLELLPFWEYPSRFGTYPLFIALQFKLFGFYEFTPILINLILFEIATIYFARCILSFGYTNTLTWIFLLWNFWPINISYSTVLLREVWYTAAIVIGVYRFINAKRLSSYQEFSFMILSILSIILHPGMLLFVLSIYFNKIAKRLAPTIAVVFIIYFGVTTLVDLGYAGGYFNFLLKDFSSDSVLERANAMRDSPFMYSKFYSGNLFNDLFVAFPIDLLNFWCTPYPFPFGNLLYYGVLRYPSGIVFIGLLVLIVVKRKQIAAKGLRKLLLVLFIASIPYVAGSSDVVQAVRHKNKYFPILLIVLAGATSRMHTSTNVRKKLNEDYLFNR